jgi:hypothetical protein
MKKLVHCINCKAVYEITPFDQRPEYHYSDTSGEYYAKEKNDELDFAQQHRGHRIEELTILENTRYSEGRYFDPQRIQYFETTNGKDTFLIKRWRKSVLNPVRHDIVPGRLEVQKTIEIQKAGLEKQMRHELNNPSLAEVKVRKFIEIVQDTARQCNPDNNYQDIYESDDAQVDYLPLDEEQISGILKRSRAVFAQDELQKIESFIRKNCACNGVMALVLKKTVFHPAPLAEPVSHCIVRIARRAIRAGRLFNTKESTPENAVH